jgi:Kef-type K+ transport system membrane component KefB
MKRTILLYVLLVSLFGLGMYLTLDYGRHLLPPKPSAGVAATITHAASVSSSGASSLLSALNENAKGPLSRLLLQVIVIMVATRTVGALFGRFGQPPVIGEMAAGILLGPSLLGWVWPEAFSFIFPKDSMGILQLLSQIGVCLFMFVVGMELEVSHLRRNTDKVVLVSHTSIMFPFLLGSVAALYLYSDYAAPGASLPAFVLFLGIAMSITAFPVLVRILEARGIAKTPLGTMAITCAAVDDATAWGILAFVVAIARATGLVSTIFSLCLVVAFVALMVWVVRPCLPHWLGLDRTNDAMPGRSAIAAALLIMTISALATEVIGIHALFGAFLAGVMMPRKKYFLDYLVVRLENFSSLFLLPLFFAFSGLRTQATLLNDMTSWLVCLGIIGIAMLGKLGGSMFIARLVGLKWNDAFALGALMNTRGLVELVALNIGYDLGILSPAIFAMLVLMALVTTFLTGPLLALAEHIKHRTLPALGAQPASTL